MDIESKDINTRSIFENENVLINRIAAKDLVGKILLGLKPEYREILLRTFFSGESIVAISQSGLDCRRGYSKRRKTSHQNIAQMYHKAMEQAKKIVVNIERNEKTIL